MMWVGASYSRKSVVERIKTEERNETPPPKKKKKGGGQLAKIQALAYLIGRAEIRLDSEIAAAERRGITERKVDDTIANAYTRGKDHERGKQNDRA